MRQVYLLYYQESGYSPSLVGIATSGESLEIMFKKVCLREGYKSVDRHFKILCEKEGVRVGDYAFVLKCVDTDTILY